MCCTQLAGNAGPKKFAIWAPLHNCVGQLRHVSTIGKKLVKQQCLPHMSSQYVNFGPLAAEICWPVWWGTPAHFNGFRILAALLNGTLVVGISQIAALNRGHHLYLAGRPSRWTLAQIVVLDLFCLQILDAFNKTVSGYGREGWLPISFSLYGMLYFYHI